MQISKNWHACSTLVSLALHRLFKIGILWSFSLCIFQTLFKSTDVLLCVEASAGEDDGGDGKGSGTAVVLLLVSFVGIICIRSNFRVDTSVVVVPCLAVIFFHFTFNWKDSRNIFDISNTYDNHRWRHSLGFDSARQWTFLFVHRTWCGFRQCSSSSVDCLWRMRPNSIRSIDFPIGR